MTLNWHKFPLSERSREEILLSYLSAIGAMASVGVLIGWFDLSFEQNAVERKIILRNLLQRAGSSEEALQAVRKLAHQIENGAVPTRRYQVADTALYKLVGALPEAEIVAIGISCLKHQRKSRRYTGLRLLNTRADDAAAEVALEAWKTNKDVACLQAAIKWGADLSRDAVQALDSLTDDYWRARLLETLSDDDVIKYATPYRLALVRMVGRACRSTLHDLLAKTVDKAILRIEQLSRQHEDDDANVVAELYEELEVVKFGFWAFARIGDGEIIERFAKRLNIVN